MRSCMEKEYIFIQLERLIADLSKVVQFGWLRATVMATCKVGSC